MKQVLTIAGSDSGGGAGIQADLKTFCMNRVYGASVITAITAQNTQGVLAVEEVSPYMVSRQLEAVFTDMDIAAVKIGMLSSAEIIRVVATALQRWQPQWVVVDPVMISTSGHALLREEARQELVQQLLPLATVVTPNMPEAEFLSGQPVVSRAEMESAAVKIYRCGSRYVLIKGGHRQEDAADLFFDGQRMCWLEETRQKIGETHGTGCSLSAAIAARLAAGDGMEQAVRAAKAYVTAGLAHARAVGKGAWPLQHNYLLECLKN